MVDMEIHSTQILIISNTWELAEQTSQFCSSIGKFKKVTVHSLIGGKSIFNDLKTLEVGAQIVSGTPGRILDMIQRGAFTLENVRLLVLDEADEIFRKNFKEQIYQIYQHLSQCQTVVLSATIPFEVIEIC